MNYYKRHIGDYMKDAAHLTLLEHGVYSRLLDVYYTREGGIPDASAERLVSARLPDEIAAVRQILQEFFVLVHPETQSVSECNRTVKKSEPIWVQKRCEAEIEAAREKAVVNRENGQKGGRPPKNRGKLPETGENAQPNRHPRNNPEKTQTVFKLNPAESQTEPKPLSTTPLANSTSSLRSDGAEAPALRRSPNARDELNAMAIPIIRGLLGVPERNAYGFLGRMLKVARDDCNHVASVLSEAADFRPAQAESWIMAACNKTRGAAKANRGTDSVAAILGIKTTPDAPPFTVFDAEPDSWRTSH